MGDTNGAELIGGPYDGSFFLTPPQEARIEGSILIKEPKSEKTKGIKSVYVWRDSRSKWVYLTSVKANDVTEVLIYLSDNYDDFKIGP